MNPETINELLFVFRKAVDALPPHQQCEEGRMALAARILALSECGESDPDVLLSAALAWNLEKNEPPPMAHIEIARRNQSDGALGDGQAPILANEKGRAMTKTVIAKQEMKRQPALRRYASSSEGIIALYAALACEPSNPEVDKLRAKFAAKDAERAAGASDQSRSAK
jgi:hypothetical protein